MSKRILIADDSVTIQKAFAMTFAAEDVTLLTARSVDEGLAVARQSLPDLIIADTSMGGRTGYDLCRALKAEPSLGQVPVYLLGSLNNPVDLARSRACAADGALVKPFDSTAMISQVHEALARGKVAASPVTVTAAAAAAGWDGVPEPAVDVGSATLEVPPDFAEITGVGDYGEIAIEPSGPNDGFEATAVESQTPPPEEDVATPPPLVRPASPAPRPAAAAPVVASAPTSPSMAPFAEPAPFAHAAAPAPAPVAPWVAPLAPSYPMAGAVGNPAGGMRPSLIPGLRPGVVPAASARAAGPSRFTAPPSGAASSASASAGGGAAAAATTLGVAAPPIGRGIAPPVPMVTPALARTLVGMPAVSAQAPARPANLAGPTGPMVTGRPGAVQAPGFPSLGFGHLPGSAAAPTRPPAATAASSGAAASAPAGALFPLAAPSPIFSKVDQKIDQKIAAISARGPEYEAIAKLSREIIEKIVWEVVPELAEAIIREELSKRGRI